MRVLVADDQLAVRSALRRLLKEKLDFTVVGEAAGVKSLLARAAVTPHDLVLLDWELPGLFGTEQAKSRFLDSLRALDSQSKVIALSSRPGARRAALDAGVDAFVSKGDPPERLLTTILAILKGLEEEIGDPGQTGDGKC
jgi:two-component system response regulator DesR